MNGNVIERILTDDMLLLCLFTPCDLVPDPSALAVVVASMPGELYRPNADHTVCAERPVHQAQHINRLSGLVPTFHVEY